MPWNWRYPGEVICIKNGKYGSMYVPSAGKAPSEGKKPAGDNALDAIKEDIERIKDENIKKNRDTLDALYNIDMRNMSESMKRLFSKMGKAVASVETLATDVEAAVNIVAQYGENLAAVQLKANQNSASINSIVKWQSEVDSSIQSTAQIQQTVRENEARISLLVNASGDGLSSSAAGIIATAIAGQDSLLQLIADKVEISADNIDLSGYVTFEDVSNEGSASISGNRISLQMMGTSDYETNDVDSTSMLNFEYWLPGGSLGDPSTPAKITFKAEGEDSDTYSRYALLLKTDRLTTRYGNVYYPAIKLQAAGRISMESDSDMVYIAATGGACTIDAYSNTRIRATFAYRLSVDMEPAAGNDYVFATDGIYYGGKKILST